MRTPYMQTKARYDQFIIEVVVVVVVVVVIVIFAQLRSEEPILDRQKK